MTTTAGTRPASTRGRKRDEDRTHSILQAAGSLLVEAGFDKFRIQDVADRAGSGVGAIYRRWETKEALAADAIRGLPDPQIEHTDNPIADLRALLHEKIAVAAANPDILPGAVAAIRGDAHIADALRDRFTTEPYRQAIARVLGPNHPQLRLLAELSTAISLHRNCLDPEPIDPDELTEEIVGLILKLQDHDASER
jgi:AcrR family transcriptional regulator